MAAKMGVGKSLMVLGMAIMIIVLTFSIIGIPLALVLAIILFFMLK